MVLIRAAINRRCLFDKCLITSAPVKGVRLRTNGFDATTGTYSWKLRSSAHEASECASTHRMQRATMRPRRRQMPSLHIRREIAPCARARRASGGALVQGAYFCLHSVDSGSRISKCSGIVRLLCCERHARVPDMSRTPFTRYAGQSIGATAQRCAHTPVTEARG